MSLHHTGRKVMLQPLFSFWSRSTWNDERHGHAKVNMLLVNARFSYLQSGNFLGNTRQL